MAGRRANSFLRSRDAGALGLLLALAMWSLVPLAIVLQGLPNGGGAITGATGLFPIDQLQYMSWIREFGHGLLASNLLDLKPSRHVFIHPMFLLSGLSLRAGLSMPWAYLLWLPVAVVALFFGFRAYVGRFLEGTCEGLLALGLSLFFAAPAGAIMSWTSLGSMSAQHAVRAVADEAFPANEVWGYFPTAISVGLLPLFLLGAERLIGVDDRVSNRGLRAVVLLACCGATISWLHPWQGETALVTLAAGLAIVRPGRRALVLLAPAFATVVPLVYYFALSRADSAWAFAQTQNAAAGGLPAWAIALALAPLGALAVSSLRRLRVSIGEWMLRIWPAAALLVYALLSPSFPRHAFEGVTLPLAILAVRGLAAHTRPLVIALVVAVLVLPGVVFNVYLIRQSIHTGEQPYRLTPDEQSALRYLDDSRQAGGVMASKYLGPVIPAWTGRHTWLGHASWTRNFRYRRLLGRKLFLNRMPPRDARATVSSSGATFVLEGCGERIAGRALRPITVSDHAFGCVHVLRLRQPGR